MIGLWIGLLVTTAAAADRPTLDRGDRAWATADRTAARAAWRDAAAAPDPAVRAEAEARLLLVSGSFGLAVHGPRAEAALAVCPDTDAWCALAEADLVLLGRHLGVPLDLEVAIDRARRVRAALPAAAAARLVWAGAAPLDALPSPDEDGVAAVLHAGEGRWLAGPGTWTTGAGVVGASGLGVGGGLRYRHPDVALRGWWVDASGILTSLLAGQVALAVRSPGRVHATVDAQAARVVADVYDDRVVVERSVVSVTGVALLPGYRTDTWDAGLGPVARWDRRDATPLPGHGLRATLGARAGDGAQGLAARARTEWAVLGTQHLEVVGSITGIAAGGRLAARVLGEAAPIAGPYWRWPTAGGGVVLRHGPLGRFRDEWLAGGAVEWRPRPDKLVGAALFAEAAWVDSVHAGGGAGLRLRLPPRPHNTLRLDAAWGDGGVGVSVGWGEAF